MTRRRALLCVALLALSSPASAATRDSPAAHEVFPGSVEPTPPPGALRPTTVYHRVSMQIALGPSDAGAWIRVLVPRSDGRQVILARDVAAEGFRSEEIPEPPNLVDLWTRRTAGGAMKIDLEFLTETSELRVAAPALPFPPAPPPANVAPFLAPSAFVQSDDPEIRSRARDITRSAKRVDEAAWTLFRYTAAFLKADPDPNVVDARTVLRQEKGNGAGKARLLAALLRSVGVPAEIVGGLRLGEATRTRATTSWVEAWIGDRWFPMDPGNDRFGELPSAYLMLYRGDRPLIVHRSNVPVDYEFVVRQVPRPSAAERDEAVATNLLRTRRAAALPRGESEGFETAATYVEGAVATVVVLTDEAIPAAVLDRIGAEARENQVNLVVLAARFPSRYFRESALGRIAGNHLAAIRDANVLIVDTRDEAGLYALLGLGDGKLRLHDARIVVAGSFPSSVGVVLGAVIFSVIEPGELALVSHRADLRSLWEVARANLLSGTPIVEAAAAWGIEPTVIDDTHVASLSRYRQRVVSAWTRAVRAQVPLAGLNLILVLPVIAFVVVLARNFVGLETFGTFSPVIVSLAFLTTGIGWGTVVFVTIVGLGACLRALLQRLHLHLVARVAILIGLVSGVMVGLTVLGAYFGIGALLHVSLFPMVIMSNLIEHFTASQVEFGTRTAVRVTANTLVACALCYAVVEGTGLPSRILAFPELLIGVLALEIAAGKWRGLRLVEYRRFRDLWVGP